MDPIKTSSGTPGVFGVTDGSRLWAEGDFGGLGFGV